MIPRQLRDNVCKVSKINCVQSFLSNAKDKAPLKKIQTNLLLIVPNEKTDSNAFVKLNELRLQNPKNVLISHLNVGLLRSKFLSKKELTKNINDILFLPETKIDETFPSC